MQGPALTTMGELTVWNSANGTLTQNGVPVRMNMANAAQDLIVGPLGNSVQTATSVNVYGKTVNPVPCPSPSACNRQFMVNLNLESHSGIEGGIGGQGDVVPLYVSVEAKPNTVGSDEIEPGVGAGVGGGRSEAGG
jgi:hypothetical protein